MTYLQTASNLLQTKLQTKAHISIQTLEWFDVSLKVGLKAVWSKFEGASNFLIILRLLHGATLRSLRVSLKQSLIVVAAPIAEYTCQECVNESIIKQWHFHEKWNI